MAAAASAGSLNEPAECWQGQGLVEAAGREAYGFLQGGGDPAQPIAALGHAVLVEDAGFRWLQLYEATVGQHHAWPTGSEQGCSPAWPWAVT